jgi:hypothetical protein
MKSMNAKSHDRSTHTFYMVRRLGAAAGKIPGKTFLRGLNVQTLDSAGRFCWRVGKKDVIGITLVYLK